MPDDLPAFVDAVEALEHVDLAGVGVNLTCYGAIMPDERNMTELVELARATEAARRPPARRRRRQLGLDRHDRLRPHAGRRHHAARRRDDPARRRHAHARARSLGLHTDVFELAAPVIECKVKPSLPRGEIAQDAYGNRPTFDDRGERRRAILALGRQDVMAEWITPLDAGVEILGASSDHLIVDVEAMPAPPRLGAGSALPSQLRCHRAAVHITVRPQGVHSAGLTLDRGAEGPLTTGVSMAERNESPDHGGRRARLPQLQHVLPRQRGVRGRRLHRHADPLHRRPQVPGRARRVALPRRHPDPRRVRDARAREEARRRAGRLRLLRRAVRVRHAPLGARQRARRRLPPARPRPRHGQEHEAGDRRLRRAHRRRQEPDHAQDPDHAARGRQEGRRDPSPDAVRRPRQAGACSATPRSTTSRSTSARSRRWRSTSPTSRPAT